MDCRLEADRAEELAVWMALRKAAEEENDMVIVTDRVRTVEKFRTERIQNNIDVDIWRITDERRRRSYSTKTEWAQRNNLGITQMDGTAADRGSGRRRVNLSQLVQPFIYRKKVKRKKERNRITR